MKPTNATMSANQPQPQVSHRLNNRRQPTQRETVQETRATTPANGAETAQKPIDNQKCIEKESRLAADLRRDDPSAANLQSRGSKPSESSQSHAAEAQRPPQPPEPQDLDLVEMCSLDPKGTLLIKNRNRIRSRRRENFDSAGKRKGFQKESCQGAEHRLESQRVKTCSRTNQSSKETSSPQGREGCLSLSEAKEDPMPRTMALEQPQSLRVSKTPRLQRPQRTLRRPTRLKPGQIGRAHV